MTKIQVQPEHEGQAVRIRLNAPKANILDMEMISQLTEAIREIGDNRLVHAP